MCFGFAGGGRAPADRTAGGWLPVGGPGRARHVLRVRHPAAVSG